MKIGKVIDLGITGERYRHYFLSRSPFFLRVAEFWNAGGAVKHPRKGEIDQKKAEEDVELHYVTRALKEEIEFIKEEGKAEKSQGKLGLEEIFTLFHIVKAVAHFRSALDKFLDATTKSTSDLFKKRVKNMSLFVIPRMFQGIKEAEEKDISPDMKYVYGIINDAAEKRTGEFVASLKTLSKEKKVKNMFEQILERRSLRKNIGVEYKYEVDVEKLAKQLEVIDKELLKDEQVAKGKVAQETYDRALNRFEKVLPRAGGDIVQMFKAAHLVLKRDLMLMAMVLADERAMKELGTLWVSKHFMPEEPIMANNAKITKLEQKLGEKAHTLANGLNVINKKIKDLETQYEVTLNKAIKIAA